MTYYPAGGSTYTLNSSIGSTDTSITLQSFTEPVSGVPYTMVLLNTSIAYGTIGPRTSSSEFISFTGITQNASGTATLTGVTRGLAKKYPFTTSSTFKLPHAGQSQFILSDAPQVFNKFVSIENDETIAGIKTFSSSPLVPTGGTGTQAANATDIANAISGASGTATNLVAGTTKLSVAAAVPSNPIAVGNNDPRVTTPLVVSLGGTGKTSLTTNTLLAGGTTSTGVLQQVGAGTSVQVLHGNASGLPTFSAVVLTTDVSGILPAANGGTGATSLPFSGLFRNGDTTKNAADASTTQNIAHGLGVVPKFVTIRAVAATNANLLVSETFYNGTTQSSVSGYLPGASITVSNSFVLNAAALAGTQTGAVTFDATNIIITWTKASSPTGTYTLVWTAQA